MFSEGQRDWQKKCLCEVLERRDDGSNFLPSWRFKGPISNFFLSFIYEKKNLSRTTIVHKVMASMATTARGDCMREQNGVYRSISGDLKGIQRDIQKSQHFKRVQGIRMSQQRSRGSQGRLKGSQ